MRRYPTEALAVTLEQNRKGVLVFRDELSGWVGSMDQYRKGADRQFFLSAWSGEMIKVDRKSSKNGPIVIPHPFISVLGGIQPDLLGTLEAKGNLEDGFLQRLLFAYPPEQPFQGWNDQEIPEQSRWSWRSIILQLLGLQQVPGEFASSAQPLVLHFSAEGRQAFIDFINQLAAEMNAADVPPRIVGVCAKLRSYCARFALILRLMRWATYGGDEGTIDANDVAGAVRLCGYFKQQSMAVYQCLCQTSESQSVEALVAWMRRHGLLQCSVRDVARAGIKGIENSTDARQLLTAAVEYGYGDWGQALGNIKHRPFILASIITTPLTNSAGPSIPSLIL